MLKNLTLNFIIFTHILIVLFLLLGAFLPKKYLIYFLFFLPFLYIHWLTNNGKCICTQLECWIGKNEYCLEPGVNFPLVDRILKYFNIYITDKKTKDTVIVYTLTIFWLIGLYRYYK